MYVGSKGVNEYSHPARKNVADNIYVAKLKAGTELDNLLTVSTYIEHVNDDGNHPEATGGWDYYKTTFKVDERFYEGMVRIMLRDNGAEFKDITKIREIIRNADQSSKEPADAHKLSYNTIISKESEKSTPEAKKSDGTIRHAKKRPILDPDGKPVSQGQADRAVANATRERVYTREDTKKILMNAIGVMDASDGETELADGFSSVL